MNEPIAVKEIEKLSTPITITADNVAETVVQIISKPPVMRQAENPLDISPATCAGLKVPF